MPVVKRITLNQSFSRTNRSRPIVLFFILTGRFFIIYRIVLRLFSCKLSLNSIKHNKYCSYTFPLQFIFVKGQFRL